MSKTPKTPKTRTPEEEALRAAVKHQIKMTAINAAITVVPTIITAGLTTVVGIAVTQAYASKYGHKTKPQKVVLPDQYDVFYPTPNAPSDI